MDDIAAHDTPLATGQRGPVEHERREQIIAAADEHFRHYGYQKTTVADLARAIGVSSAYLSALEHGRRGRPGWHLVQRIITYFNIIWDEAEDVARLARISHPRVVIDTSGLDPRATEFANRLSDEISRLDRKALDELSSVLAMASLRLKG